MRCSRAQPRKVSHLCVPSLYPSHPGLAAGSGGCVIATGLPTPRGAQWHLVGPGVTRQRVAHGARGEGRLLLLAQPCFSSQVWVFFWGTRWPRDSFQHRFHVVCLIPAAALSSHGIASLLASSCPHHSEDRGDHSPSGGTLGVLTAGAPRGCAKGDAHPRRCSAAPPAPAAAAAPAAPAAAPGAGCGGRPPCAAGSPRSFAAGPGR